MRPAMVASGELKDGALDAVLARPVAQGAASGIVIGEAVGVPAGLKLRVEPIVAGVNAGDNGRRSARGDGWAARIQLWASSSGTPVTCRDSVPTRSQRARVSSDSRYRLSQCHSMYSCTRAGLPRRLHDWTLH